MTIQPSNADRHLARLAGHKSLEKRSQTGAVFMTKAAINMRWRATYLQPHEIRFLSRIQMRGKKMASVAGHFFMRQLRSAIGFKKAFQFL